MMSNSKAWLPLSSWMRDRQSLKQVKMGGISDHPDCSSNDRCNTVQMRETSAL